MSAAALALALALLIAPGPPRHRVRPPGGRGRPSAHLPVVPCLAAALVALATVAPVGVVGAVAILATTVEVRRRRRRQQRLRASEAVALQGALDVLVGELRVGAHPVVAFDAAAEEVDGVVGASMRTVAARARMGADVAEGLRSVAGRSALPAYWERLSVCWKLANARGLAIATLMHTAQRDIVARERFAAQVSAGMAGARTTAVVLGGLPLLGLGLGQLIGADPVSFLFARGAGQWLLLIGVMLSCAGLAWSDHITAGVLR